jgi:hypothetical protein
MSRQTLIAVVLALVFIGFAVWWFFTNFEYRVEEQDLGYGTEARRNQYLAAERFLEKFDMQIKSIPSMLEVKSLPPPSDVLFMPTARYDLSSKRVQELLAWVKRGGQLITRARPVAESRPAQDDPLFYLLGVTTHVMKEHDHNKSHNPSVINVHVNSAVEDKKVEFDMNVWMTDTKKHELNWRVKGKNGSQILEYHLGAGYVTLLSDLHFLNNNSIADNDHAAFLYALVHLDSSDRKIWIVRHDDLPSLLSIMWEKSPASLIALSVLLAIWLWYTTRRFGPLLMRETGKRRSLREHISSSGYYQWRNNNRSALFMSAKTALQEQIAQTRPLWIKLGDSELSEKLGKIAGIPADKVLRVLQCASVEKEVEFTQYIEILSLIRKSL